MSDDRGTVTADEPLFKAVVAKPHARTRGPRPWGMYGTIAGFAAVVALGILSRPKGNRAAATPEPTPIAIETEATTPEPEPEPTSEETAIVRRTPIPTPVRTPVVVAATPVRTPVALATPVRTATPRPAPSAAPSPSAVPSSSAAPRLARKGTLSIWMVGGWASISIDGKPTGANAPVVGLEVPEGKHRVTLENQGLDFRRDYDVVIQPGRESKLSVSLD